jgi:hypothetical protein
MDRRAALMLAEYLASAPTPGNRLTGHADARGSDSYNMELSQQRLEAVALPKNPWSFAGADRRLLGHEDVLWLDPRMEMRPAQYPRFRWLS